MTYRDTSSKILAFTSPLSVNEPDFMATVLTLVESELGISLVPRCVRSLNRPVAIRAITPKSARSLRNYGVCRGARGGDQAHKK